MFEFYQVKHISFKFVPYKYQGNAATDGTSVIETIFPTISMISPDSNYPVLGANGIDSEYFSFGNA